MAEHDCSEALSQLQVFLDGELTDERRRLIAHHLDLCPPCLDRHDFEAELRRVVAQRCRDQVPDDLKIRIEAAIRAQSGAESGSG